MRRMLVAGVHRKEVAAVTPLEFGDLAEDYFFDAVIQDTGNKPPWFGGIERADALWDVRGVDGFAIVRYPDGRDIFVPVQVKTSAKSLEMYYGTHPWARKARVVIVVVHLNQARDLICQDLYIKLEKVRRDQVWYADVLRRVESKPIVERELEIMEHIEERRQQRAGAIVTPLERPQQTRVWLRQRLWARVRGIFS